MRSIVILTASLAIIVLGIWGTAVIYLDEERLKSIVARQMMEQTGRKVEIAGALRVKLFPRIHLRAEQVVISGPEGYVGPELLEADELAMSVRMLPLIRGNVSAGQMQLSGARIHLHTDADGSSSLDGLASLAGRADLLSSRQMRLEDVTLVVSDISTRRRDSITIDWVELDRFSLDSAVEFRFRGNIGDPPVFRELYVDGLLHVPSTRARPTRLANMRLTGELAGSGLPLTLLGNLMLSSRPPLRFALDEGRLDLLDQRFEINAAYDGGELPQLALEIAGERLAGGQLRDALFSDAGHNSGADWMLPFIRGMAIDARMQLDQLHYGALVLDDVRGDLDARDGVAAVGGVAGFPGGVTELTGLLDGRHEPPQGDFSLDIQIAQVERLMTALQLPAVLAGSGMARLEMTLATDRAKGGTGLLQGEFELWDGRWMVSGVNETTSDVEFDRLAGRFRLLPDHLDLPEIVLESGRDSAIGWAAIELPALTIGGQLIRSEDNQEVEISGTMADPQFSAPLLTSPKSSSAVRIAPNADTGPEPAAAR